MHLRKYAINLLSTATYANTIMKLFEMPKSVSSHFRLAPQLQLSGSMNSYIMRGRREATQAQAPGLVPVKMDLPLKLKLIVIKFRNERRRIGSNCRRIDEILRGLGATIRMYEERMRSILLWSQNDPTLVTS